MKVSELIAKAQKGTANSKELGILSGVRHCRFTDADGISYTPEMFFTLRQWREIENKGESVPLKEAVEIVPELSSLVAQPQNNDDEDWD